MTTTRQYEAQQDQRAKLFDGVLGLLSPEALADPNLPDAIGRAVDRQLAAGGIATAPPPSAGDSGFADLIGIGDAVATDLGTTQVTEGVVDYDDTLRSERILGTADLYYLYMHEALGAFRVVWKLQELFRAGTLRISSGPGAFGLYRFDKQSVLRYATQERFSAYRRVLGYSPASPGANARANTEFHVLFSHFIGETARFWRDKRISDVIRQRADDPSFGSIAIVRRAGLDLRNNLKNSSYGWVNVLRIETLQALSDAFKILSADDVRAQFGAETAWDTIELVMWQYFGIAVSASPINRMAVTGRDILQWLAEPYVLKTNRREFEASLYQIAESAEEWLSSEEARRLSRPTPPARNVYLPGPPPRGVIRQPVVGRPAARHQAPRWRSRPRRPGSDPRATVAPMRARARPPF